jgi:gliding motility-associated-like protein
MWHGSVPLLVVANTDTLRSSTWQPVRYLSCSSCTSPIATPPYTTTFSTVGYNQHSCIDTAYVMIKTFTGGEVNIPTGFTPNGDGKNDVFYILADKEAAMLTDFAVYDRWGKAVFHVSHVIPNTPVYGWNGTVNGMEASAGTYIYHVTVQFADGSQKLYQGTVVLIK